MKISFAASALINYAQLKKRGLAARKEAQFALDEDVLGRINSNYLPFRDGILAASGISSSRIGEGQIIWSTPYARRHYYNPQYNFDTTKNSQAGGMWFERAKAAHLSDWVKLAARPFGKEF